MENEKKLVWSEKSKKELCKTPVFTVTQTESVSPEGKTGKFIVMDAPEWGIIVPTITKENEKYFVMVKQWRHGTRSLSIEFPGGVLEKGENPMEGVMRELEEETGYRAESVVHLGTVSPNPAIMSNRLHIYASDLLIDTKNRNLDEDEFVDVLLIKEKEVYENMGKEPYIHAFMSTALFLYSQGSAD